MKTGGNSVFMQCFIVSFQKSHRGLRQQQNGAEEGQRHTESETHSKGNRNQGNKGSADAGRWAAQIFLRHRHDQRTIAQSENAGCSNRQEAVRREVSGCFFSYFQIFFAFNQELGRTGLRSYRQFLVWQKKIYRESDLSKN